MTLTKDSAPAAGKTIDLARLTEAFEKIEQVSAEAALQRTVMQKKLEASTQALDKAVDRFKAKQLDIMVKDATQLKRGLRPVKTVKFKNAA